MGEWNPPLLNCRRCASRPNRFVTAQTVLPFTYSQFKAGVGRPFLRLERDRLDGHHLRRIHTNSAQAGQFRPHCELELASLRQHLGKAHDPDAPRGEGSARRPAIGERHCPLGAVMLKVVTVSLESEFL